MKIYMLPANKILQPHRQPWKFPAHSKDYGVEQDFLKYLLKEKNLLTNDLSEADWHYLPVYWTRWHLNHNFAQTGLEELQDAVQKTILNDEKTFTICQYDDGPVIDLGKAVLFLSSRKTKEGIDIPLLCSPHQKPLFKPSKKYSASFLGTVRHHPLRVEMAQQLASRSDIYLNNGMKSRVFVQKMLESYIALCPRGYGGSSFRLFEAMQLGIVPLVISDIDTRPFKGFINWNDISFFSHTASNVEDYLDSFEEQSLLRMGELAYQCWKENLQYQKWCKYVIWELEKLQ
jgi:hypothetical protein